MQAHHQTPRGRLPTLPWQIYGLPAPLCPRNWAAAKHTQIGLERETLNILPNAHKC